MSVAQRNQRMAALRVRQLAPRVQQTKRRAADNRRVARALDRQGDMLGTVKRAAQRDYDQLLDAFLSLQTEVRADRAILAQKARQLRFKERRLGGVRARLMNMQRTIVGINTRASGLERAEQRAAFFARVRSQQAVNMNSNAAQAASLMRS